MHTERQAKLQEHLRQLTVLFRKLRLVFDKCREKAGPGEPEVEYGNGVSDYLMLGMCCKLLSPSEQFTPVGDLRSLL